MAVHHYLCEAFNQHYQQNQRNDPLSTSREHVRNLHIAEYKLLQSHSQVIIIAAGDLVSI